MGRVLCVFVQDLINASDLLLGKLGYGTTSEASTHPTPLTEWRYI